MTITQVRGCKRIHSTVEAYLQIRHEAIAIVAQSKDGQTIELQFSPGQCGVLAYALKNQLELLALSRRVA